MARSRILIWLESVFVKRPLVGIACALLGPLVAQRAIDSATIADMVIVVSWMIITREVYRTFPSLKNAAIDTRRFSGTVLLSLLIGGGLYATLWRHESRFAIIYSNSALNGQDIRLERSIDPTIRQIRMFVEPNFPSAFSTVGILVRNEGDSSLIPDGAYLSFSGPVEKLQRNAGCWEPSPDRNVKGWTIFECSFNRVSVDPGYAVSVPDFLGTPIPNDPVKVRVTVLYGRQEASAEFTIRP